VLGDGETSAETEEVSSSSGRGGRSYHDNGQDVGTPVEKPLWSSVSEALSIFGLKSQILGVPVPNEAIDFRV
jgi:hypothetical protein